MGCPATIEIQVDDAPLRTEQCSLVVRHRGWHQYISEDYRMLLTWYNADDPAAAAPEELDAAIMTFLRP